MPNKINAWDNSIFRTMSQSMELMNLFHYLPDGTFSSNEYAQIIDIGLGGDFGQVSEQEQQSRKNKFGSIAQADEAGNIILQGNTIGEKIPGEDASETVNATLNSVVETLRAQSKKRNDPRIKRFYTDMADVHDTRSGNYAKMYFSAPYLMKLATSMTEIVRPTEVSSDELKAQLGVPLFEASFDFTHAIAMEISNEYRLQYLELEGQFVQDGTRQNLLEDIYKSHTNILAQYEKLKEFYDDPQGQTTTYMSKSLSNLFGRDNANDSSIDSYIGMIRGETQAIRNGWQHDDMYILGVIGGIEAEIKRQEEFINKGNNEDEIKNKKADFIKFKAQFYGLKDSCYYKVIGSASDKKNIADRVKEFVQASIGHEATSIAKACCKDVGTNINRIEEIQKIIDNKNNIENRDSTKTEDYKKLYNPTSALINMHKRGIRFNNYRQFVIQYLDLKEKVNRKYKADDPKRIDFEEQENMIFSYLLNNKNVFKIQKAVAELYYEKQIEYGQYLEQKTLEVREGLVNLKQPFAEKLDNKEQENDNIKKINESIDLLQKDQLFAIRNANELLNKSKTAHDLDLLESLYKRINESLDNSKDIEKHLSHYIKNGSDGLSKAERLFYFRQARERSSALEGSFGIEKKHGEKMESPAKNTYVIETVRKEYKVVNNYIEKFISVQQEVAKHLDELDRLAEAKSNNSQAFNNMRNALLNVSKVTLQDTPKKMNDALLNLDAASRTYENKISNQTFAGILSNGKKRVTKSKDLQKFAKDSYKKLADLPENMEVNEPTIEQLARAHSMVKTIRGKWHDEMEAGIESKLTEIKNQYLIGYAPNKSAEENRLSLEMGISGVLALNALKKKFAEDDTCLVNESDYNKAQLLKNHEELVANEGFNKMVGSITNNVEFNRICDMAKNNPGELIMELDSINKDLEHKMNNPNEAYDANYISDPRPKNRELKNPSANKNPIIQ